MTTTAIVFYNKIFKHQKKKQLLRNLLHNEPQDTTLAGHVVRELASQPVSSLMGRES